MKEGRKERKDIGREGSRRQALFYFPHKLFQKKVCIFMHVSLARGRAGVFESSMDSLNGSHSYKIVGFYEINLSVSINI